VVGREQEDAVERGWTYPVVVMSGMSLVDVLAERLHESRFNGERPDRHNSVQKLGKAGTAKVSISINEAGGDLQDRRL